MRRSSHGGLLLSRPTLHANVCCFSYSSPRALFFFPFERQDKTNPRPLFFSPFVQQNNSCPSTFVLRFWFTAVLIASQRPYPKQEGGSVFEDTDISKILGGRTGGGGSKSKAASGYVPSATVWRATKLIPLRRSEGCVARAPLSFHGLVIVGQKKTTCG